jgi:hypothetical protein
MRCKANFLLKVADIFFIWVEIGRVHGHFD